ncbi:MAG: CerR family C-terminal domain-containing protein [Magnetococcales bacterium]|nr:CerR family C-terminal domain-containing protein [Magnetococcales bacterium]
MAPIQTNSVNQHTDGHKDDSKSKTRERLLKAGLHAFGHQDYDGVSTRQIAEAAGANISAISYHFGGKRQLYLATAAYIVEKIHAFQDKYIGKVNSELQEMQKVEIELERCRLLLQNLLRKHAINLLTGELGEDVPGFVLREQSHPTEAFEILYSNLFEPLHTLVSKLVALIRGLPTGHRESDMVAHALLGQILFFRVARTTMLRRLGQQSYTSQDVQQISQLVSTLANHALNYPVSKEETL